MAALFQALVLIFVAFTNSAADTATHSSLPTSFREGLLCTNGAHRSAMTNTSSSILDLLNSTPSKLTAPHDLFGSHPASYFHGMLCSAGAAAPASGVRPLVHATLVHATAATTSRHTPSHFGDLPASYFHGICCALGTPNATPNDPGTPESTAPLDATDVNAMATAPSQSSEDFDSEFEPEVDPSLDQFLPILLARTGLEETTGSAASPSATAIVPTGAGGSAAIVTATATAPSPNTSAPVRGQQTGTADTPHATAANLTAAPPVPKATNTAQMGTVAPLKATQDVFKTKVAPSMTTTHTGTATSPNANTRPRTKTTTRTATSPRVRRTQAPKKASVPSAAATSSYTVTLGVTAAVLALCMLGVYGAVHISGYTTLDRNSKRRSSSFSMGFSVQIGGATNVDGLQHMDGVRQRNRCGSMGMGV